MKRFAEQIGFLRLVTEGCCCGCGSSLGNQFKPDNHALLSLSIHLSLQLISTSVPYPILTTLGRLSLFSLSNPIIMIMFIWFRIPSGIKCCWRRISDPNFTYIFQQIMPCTFLCDHIMLIRLYGICLVLIFKLKVIYHY